MFNKQLSRKNTFFCSQFVATVLQRCEIVKFNKPPALVMPHDLMENEDFIVVFQGSLKEYFLTIECRAIEKNTCISTNGQEKFGQSLAIS